jgi:hypothetical protein
METLNLSVHGAVWALRTIAVPQRREQAKSVYNHSRFAVKKEIPAKSEIPA